MPLRDDKHIAHLPGAEFGATRGADPSRPGAVPQADSSRAHCREILQCPEVGQLNTLIYNNFF